MNQSESMSQTWLEMLDEKALECETKETTFRQSLFFTRKREAEKARRQVGKGRITGKRGAWRLTWTGWLQYTVSTS